jgi:hypothetical protein
VLKVRVAGEQEYDRFDARMGRLHYWGAGRAVGDYLRQIVELDGQPAALLVWGPACCALKDRDLSVSWSAPQRGERLKLILGHRGGVEIRNHWRRGAILGEDRSRSRDPNLPANLALIRSALLLLLTDQCPAQPLPQVREQLHCRPSQCLNLLHS